MQYLDINVIFKYNYYILQLGDKFLVGIICGTAVRLMPLPEPQDPKKFILNNFGDDNKELINTVSKILSDYHKDSNKGLNNCFYHKNGKEKEIIQKNEINTILGSEYNI